jgi:DNA-3-methyladenine glycosylase I
VPRGGNRLGIGGNRTTQRRLSLRDRRVYTACSEPPVDTALPFSSKLTRCPWCEGSPEYVTYHDLEWGVPVHDDRRLHEFLLLEGAQAGLSWLTILRKRAAYARAFAGFDPAKVARFGTPQIGRLLHDEGIVRNRLKLEAAVGNAKAFLGVQDSFGSFDAYIWRFVDGRPTQNRWRALGEVPASTSQSDAMSKDLKQRGFKFVGTTICYAFMQAVGMVNDHLIDCYRWRELETRN